VITGGHHHLRLVYWNRIYWLLSVQAGLKPWSSYSTSYIAEITAMLHHVQP
jgi:hypothetical protein